MPEASAREARAQPEAPAGGAFERPREWLLRRTSFRVGTAVLALLSLMAVYAPFLANDRPLYLVAVHREEFERARRTLTPVAQALADLLARPASEYHTPRAVAARAAERTALAARLASVRASQQPDRAAALVSLERELEAVAAIDADGD